MIPRDEAERIANKILDGWHWDNGASTISRNDFGRYLINELRAELVFTECAGEDCMNPPAYCSSACALEAGPRLDDKP